MASLGKNFLVWSIASNKSQAVLKCSFLGHVSSTNSGYGAFQQYFWAWVFVCPLRVRRQVDETISVVLRSLPKQVEVSCLLGLYRWEGNFDYYI